MTRIKDKNNKAFTLIELLVVIAIIALLMAILMPSLAKAKKQAQQAACMAQLKNWSLALAAYTNDNNGYFWKAITLGWGYTWLDVIRPYIGTKTGTLSADTKSNFDAWCCPAAKVPQSKGGKWPRCAWGVFSGTYGGANVDGAYGSFGFNSFCENDDGVFGSARQWKTPNVKNAGTVPMFFDSLWVCGWPDPVCEPPEYEGEMPTQAAFSEMMKYIVTNRHDGFMDFVFMDSAVRPVGLKELWRLKWNQLTDLKTPLPVWPDWMKKFKEYK
jgi:prepilin-type N-terminal cleavage/methylation domain-containing protein